MGKNSKKTCFKRMAAGLATVLVAPVMMTVGGCAKGDVKAASDVNEEQPANELECVPPLTDYVSDEEYALADQWSSCDDAALARVMRKAAAGEKVTIACIGGSITQGTISDGTIDDSVGFKKKYADIFFEWWTATFPDADFNFINAGIGGTDSYLGVHRVQEEVLDFNPDLVLVEFSVNDADSPSFKLSYDNLVRKILLSDSSPAVMLLFMGQTNGTTAQASHVIIGFNYELPMLSYHNVIQDMMEQGAYTDKELSADEVHPSALGHAIVGELLWKYLNSVYVECETLAEPLVFSEKAVTSEKYMAGRILDAADIEANMLGTFALNSVCEQFPNGWTCESGEGGLEITAEFKNLGILYYSTVDGKSGQFDVYVDGERVKTIDADFTGGWGDATKADEVYSSDGVSTHTVVIKKSESSTGDLFSVLGFMVS